MAKAKATPVFVETRDTRSGTFSILHDIQVNWVKVFKAVPGFNGGKPQFELQIAAEGEQLDAILEILPNMKVSEEGLSSFTLKRPAFLGAPGVVDNEGGLVDHNKRKTIGNGSRGDVKISHKFHPTTNRPYVCLEALRITELVPFLPDGDQFATDFDF
jgi:hypothetical protein